jgi:hypothetical protein
MTDQDRREGQVPDYAGEERRQVDRLHGEWREGR